MSPEGPRGERMHQVLRDAFPGADTIQAGSDGATWFLTFGTTEVPLRWTGDGWCYQGRVSVLSHIREWVLTDLVAAEQERHAKTMASLVGPVVPGWASRKHGPSWELTNGDMTLTVDQHGVNWRCGAYSAASAKEAVRQYLQHQYDQEVRTLEYAKDEAIAKNSLVTAQQEQVNRVRKALGAL